MPATTKDELLTVTVKEFGKLERLLARLDGEAALVKDADGTSIKDIVGHRAHWIYLFFGWYRDGRDGRRVSFPAEGYKWNDLKRYNADLRAVQATLQWGEACSMLRDAHERLVGFIQDRSDEQLYLGPMAGGNNAWTTGRWAEATGPSHYRSAAKYIRSRLQG